MYSPKISAVLVQQLYHAAKARHLPMTKLVNRLIKKGLATEDLPQAVNEARIDFTASPKTAA